jgi:hypothetical protein
MRAPRTEEVKEFLVLEALGQAAQPPSNAGIAGFNLLDPCQQLVQIRGGDGFASDRLGLAASPPGTTV